MPFELRRDNSQAAPARNSGESKGMDALNGGKPIFIATLSGGLLIAYLSKIGRHDRLIGSVHLTVPVQIRSGVPV